MIKGFFKFIFWTTVTSIGTVIALPFIAVGLGAWKAVPVMKTVFPVGGFIFGVCYPFVHIIAKWELVMARDPYSIMVMLFPLVYWKIMDSMGKISFPPLFIIVPYVVIALTVLTVALSGF